MEKGLSKIPDSEISTQETLPAQNPNRVVIFGSHLAGAHILSRDFKKFLKEKGIPNPVVNYVRSIENIKKGFFDYVDPADVERELEMMKMDPWYGWGPHYETSSTHPTLPRGVILLPEMRNYDMPYLDKSVSVDDDATSFQIRELCEKYGVPLVVIRENYSSEQVQEVVSKMLTEGNK